ncbi:hypothetical protein [Lactiplantibacillus plantarum]|uniref:hypothetical protein n=1 Tax=Lactiplantibacillus plantarum TaxID=1590 RepID=UPI00223FFE57|nr:hypothetical protein [Lactiplantibacillus plantarum]
MPTIKDYYLPKRPTLLFSLHPEPTQAIINGTKILEYRRRFFARPFQAFVYTTGDNGGIQLFLRCDQGLQLVPEQLALVGALLQHDAPTTTAAYFEGAKAGLALPITAFTTLPNIPLAQLRRQFENFVTPRSYVFLDQPDRQAQLDGLLTQPCESLTILDWRKRYAALATLLQK